MCPIKIGTQLNNLLKGGLIPSKKRINKYKKVRLRKMKTKLLLIIALIINFNSVVFAKSYKVSDISQYKENLKKVVAGDSIILSNGIWKDVQFQFKGKGGKDKYIYLIAETPGKVFIEGVSRLQLSGEYLYVSGLIFTNGYTPKSAVIEFRTSTTDYAYNCILSNCVIDKFNQLSKDSTDHWVGIWGKKNIVENCYFGGKTNEGTTLVVWPNDSNSINNEHLIYRNYFGPRPRLGANGGETIRIGTSQVCNLSSGTIVDGNFFDHCNGEVEIISNKSGDNKFVNNTFYECEGSLVLRHGNNALVSGNWFIGNGKPFTGGIRVINQGHKIFNNYFYKLAGDEFRSGTAIMNGIPNSPANGYLQVKNVIIANNTYFDCAYPLGFGVGFGERNRIARPEGVLLLNNIIYCPNTSELIKRFDTTDGVMLDNNFMVNNSGVLKGEGVVEGEILKAKYANLDIVYSNLKAKKIPFIKYDILGQIRGEAIIGAFQNSGEKPEIQLATAKNCGPEWNYKFTVADTDKTKSVGKTISITPETNNLAAIIKKSGENDVLLLSSGEYVINNKIPISKNITIKRANENDKPIIKLASDRENNCFFEIRENAKVRFDGIAFNGDSKAKYPAKYIFIAKEANAYSLVINNCEIYDVNVETGAVIKAYKGTMADSIDISNSVIKDVFRGISLSDEKDDIGKYSVENLVLENSVFNNIAQYAVDYYRGGNDESTLGGSLYMNHCVFNDVASTEKQTVLKLTNIVKVDILNTIFNTSMAKTVVKLSGQKNIIENCCFYDCSKPKVENGAQMVNLFFDNPKFEKKSFTLSGKSTLKQKATDGGDIGLR